MALMSLVQASNGDGLPRLDAHLLALEFRGGLIANAVSGVYGKGVYGD